MYTHIINFIAVAHYRNCNRKGHQIDAFMLYRCVEFLTSYMNCLFEFTTTKIAVLDSIAHITCKEHSKTRVLIRQYMKARNQVMFLKNLFPAINGFQCDTVLASTLVYIRSLCIQGSIAEAEMSFNDLYPRCSDCLNNTFKQTQDQHIRRAHPHIALCESCYFKIPRECPFCPVHPGRPIFIDSRRIIEDRLRERSIELRDVVEDIITAIFAEEITDIVISSYKEMEKEAEYLTFGIRRGPPEFCAEKKGIAIPRIMRRVSVIDFEMSEMRWLRRHYRYVFFTCEQTFLFIG
jgi:hypothetical protein